MKTTLISYYLSNKQARSRLFNLLIALAAIVTIVSFVVYAFTPTKPREGQITNSQDTTEAGRDVNTGNTNTSKGDQFTNHGDATKKHVDGDVNNAEGSTVIQGNGDHRVINTETYIEEQTKIGTIEGIYVRKNKGAIVHENKGTMYMHINGQQPQ